MFLVGVQLVFTGRQYFLTKIKAPLDGQTRHCQAKLASQLVYKCLALDESVCLHVEACNWTQGVLYYFLAFKLANCTFNATTSYFNLLYI